MNTSAFRFGPWQVLRSSNTLSQGEVAHQVEPRVMDVLVALCERDGGIVSAEELLLKCWGSTLYGDNPVHKTIAQLRRVLGDDAVAPVFIETIRKRGYRTVAEVVMPSSPPVPAAGSWHGGSPFRGLQAFDAEHAAIFFGRDEATAALVAALGRQAEAGRALQLVLGPSGSGKTSIIRAGLLPALERGAAGFEVLSSAVIDLGELHEGQLFSGLGGTMLDWQLGEQGIFDGHSADSLGRLLQHDAPAVRELVEGVLAARPPRQRLVLVIDRLEAIFSQPYFSHEQRESLVRMLDTLSRSGRMVLIVACRNDFYPHIAGIPLLLEGKANGAHFDLAPPSHAEIAHIVRLPALAACLTFGSDPDTHERLDDVLCRAGTTSPDALPLLQYTLQELYRLRSPSGELGLDTYRQLGGIEGALGMRAEAVVAALGPEPHAALARVLSLLVTVSVDDERVTSRRAPWSALKRDAERELVGALVEARLFVSELVGTEAVFGVAHEALLRRWDRVVQWVSVHREHLVTRARVTQQAGRWAEHGRRADFLLPQGRQLEEAQAMLAAADLPLAAQERALIAASAARARRRDRLRMGAVALIAMLALVAGGAWVSALGAKQVAQQRRSEAEGLMGFMLGDFADRLRPLARLDLLDAVSTKALEYLAVSGADELDGASLTHRAKALQVIGEVRIARGDPAAAAAALAAAQVILARQLDAAPRDPGLLKQRGGNAFWLGKLAMDHGEWDRAQAFFVQYRNDADRLAAIVPGDVDAMVEQSYAHNSLGSLALKRGDASGAAAEFALSIALKTEAMRRKPLDRMLAKDLADSLSWAGSANEALGRLDDARALYMRQLSLAEALRAAAPGDALWRDKLAETHQHLARIDAVRGDGAAALGHYGQAEALLKQNMAAAPGNRGWQASLGFVQLAILKTAPRHGDVAAEFIRLQALKKTFAELHGIDPKNRTWARHEALAWQLEAAFLAETGRTAQARALLAQAQDRLRMLHVSNLSDIFARTLLAQALLAGTELTGVSTSGTAAAQCREAAGLLAPLVPGSNDFRILDPWVRAQLCLSNGHAASDAIARLSRIGYREHAYMKSLSLYSRKKP